jgi:DNA-binding MarR family transcriptional regulator
MSNSNVNAKGRRIRGNFAHVPCAVLSHAAVTSLSHAQFRVLVLMAGQFNGHNNGALGLTASQAAEQGIASERTLYAALRELERRGLIERTFPASRIPPRPTMYALTWRAVDRTGFTDARPRESNAYLDWRPEK